MASASAWQKFICLKVLQDTVCHCRLSGSRVAQLGSSNAIDMANGRGK